MLWRGVIMSRKSTLYFMSDIATEIKCIKINIGNYHEHFRKALKNKSIMSKTYWRTLIEQEIRTIRLLKYHGGLK
jgi:hypothetical protein